MASIRTPCLACSRIYMRSAAKLPAMKAPPDTDDLLRALEQSEIALESAIKVYESAAEHLHRATPVHRPQASYELSRTMKEVLRQRARRDRLRAEIAHARAAAGQLGRPALLPTEPAPLPDRERDHKAPSRCASPRR
jgi:hypothetical protein